MAEGHIDAKFTSAEVEGVVSATDAVILFSHGSLLCGSGQALLGHADRLRSQGIAPIVAVGYLNYSEPFFLDTVTQCIAKGATRIVVTPYFLASGYFVKVELTKAIAQAREAFPTMEFVVGEAIGFDERLADALILSAEAALPAENWHDDLERANAHCRDNPECPLYSTPNCPHRRASVQEAVS